MQPEKFTIDYSNTKNKSITEINLIREPFYKKKCVSPSGAWTSVYGRMSLGCVCPLK
jgi:hypothetical protein